MPFTDGAVLVVCTANRCRSPIAAALLARRAAAAGLGWTVSSAGARARRGEHTEPEAVAVLAEVGIDVVAQPVRRLDVATAAAAQLVLTAERAHRSRVLELAPALTGRVFTLLEIERLLAAATARDPDRRARTPTEVAALAESARWLAGPAGSADDLPDPVGRPLADYRACLQRLDRVAAQLVAAAGSGR